jgi:hypothetical protein
MQNSLLNSLLAGKLRGDWCDQHCVASQAVRDGEAPIPRSAGFRPERRGSGRAGASLPALAKMAKMNADTLSPCP